MKLFEAFGSRLLLLLPIGIILGCSTPPKAKREQTADYRNPSQIPMVEEKSFFPQYRLGFGDVVEVKVFDNERFNDAIAIRPDGRITIEKIGDIFVAGMTPSQLDSLITRSYAKFIRNPDVTVFVRQFGGYQVYVLGEVNSPGGYPLQRDMTLLQALATAGGPREIAQLHSVVILRLKNRKEIETLKVDLTAAIKGIGSAFAEDEIYMQAQDVIYVPRTFISNFSTFMRQVYDGLLPPLDIYLRALWWRDR